MSNTPDGHRAYKIYPAPVIPLHVSTCNCRVNYNSLERVKTLENRLDELKYYLGYSLNRIEDGDGIDENDLKEFLAEAKGLLKNA